MVRRSATTSLNRLLGLLGEEGGLAHRHPAAGAEVGQGVADLEAVGGDPVRGGLLPAVHLELV